MKCIKCGINELTTGDYSFVCSDCRNKAKEQPILTGWICPRCGIVHSPFVTQCSCPPPTRVWTGTSTEETICKQ